MRYHLKNRVNGKGASDIIEQTDIVLTTYGEVVRSYPKCVIPKDIKESNEKEAYWVK